jgi:hypothetical protein
MDKITKPGVTVSSINPAQAKNGSPALSANTGNNTPSAVTPSNKPFSAMTSSSSNLYLHSANHAGGDGFRFTGHLKTLNKKSPGEQANFFKENAEDLIGDSRTINQLANWLSKSVTHSNEANNKVAEPIYNMIRENKALLQSVAAQDQEDKDTVGEFMTEALRSYNFARHDSAAIRDFMVMLKDMNIAVHGEPEKCIAVASFAGLAYLPGQGVVMQAK